MPDYYLHLYDTSGRRVPRGSVRISAADDFEAVTKTAVHGPSDVYRAVLIDGTRIVSEWPSQRSAAQAGSGRHVPLIDSR